MQPTESGSLYINSGIKSYVLRGGRMSSSQTRSYDKLYGTFCIPYQENPLLFSEVFGNDNPVIIEIGFGMGVTTAEIALKNSEKNYLGIEVFKAGVGHLLWEIEKNNLLNIRIIEHDAVFILQNMIPDNSVSAFHIFFPDPWPKKKHNKRRLVKRPFTSLLASKLENNGYIYFISDWKDYADFALCELGATEHLANPYEKFAPKQEWRPPTKFEQKGINKNYEINELIFKKVL